MAHDRPGGSRFAGLLSAGPAVIASVATWAPATSPPTSRPAPPTATPCCGVVLFANVVAMLFQALSAKLGIATGRDLAEHCRDNFSPRGAGDVG